MKGSNGSAALLDDTTIHSVLNVSDDSLTKNQNDRKDSIEYLRAFSSKSMLVPEMMLTKVYKERYKFEGLFDERLWASSSKSIVINDDVYAQLRYKSKGFDKNTPKSATLMSAYKKQKSQVFFEKVVYLFVYTGVSLLILAFLFIPLEKVFPAKNNQSVFRKKWAVDLSYFLGQYLVWNSIVLALLNYFEAYVAIVLPKSFQSIIASQPFFIQCIEVVILSDVLLYWAHRWQHHSRFLWRFHKIHHSTETMDWLASHREHPLDTIYTLTVVNLPAIIMGFSLNSLAFLVIFRGIWAIYIHSNVNLNIGVLKYIFGSPQLHHWHHDVNKQRGNYANISPLMDLIFGTYYEKQNFPENYGIDEPLPSSYFKQIIHPILPNWFKKTN